MSDESTQLSVAELLARNGQGVPASGGGRRRRGGRGISVTELTGDLPSVREGSSSHAAPDAEDPSDYRMDAPPAAVEPSYSPLSGPISYYDPLAPSAPEPSYRPPAPPDPAPRDAVNFGWEPLAGSSAPTLHSMAEADRRDPFASPNGAHPTPGGRRARRERLEAEQGPEPDRSMPEPPPAGGRRRRRDHDDETTEVRPFRGPAPQADPQANIPTLGWSPTRAPEPPAAPALPRRDRTAERPDRGPRPEVGQRAEPGPYPRSGRRGDAPPEPGLPAWSARRRPGPDAPGPKPGRPEPDPAGAPTAMWSMANRDQQLLAGPTVAGDLLRDAAERGDRRGTGKRRESGGRRGGTDLLEYDDRTDVYEPLESDRGGIDLDEDDEPAPPKKRAATRSTRGAAARSRAARKKDDDAARKQWMILGGQAVGAAVAGMLLFKGFEKMWDVLPFVALTLAMVVILGLVALVRVLRRTDDIYSTVIAVVVGIFVTLGPLAFLLSTN
ncbi:hypothetical protein [Nocardia terpenica]|uniref:Uncharacterized protein n=1 Tax=Nocardia terpenica TaxID=455432 RepID=A0A164JYD0_9NOCA|nr:hypothetical protein [Nocardia terpenica]KZM70846.1 hypothetical protein AWN90_40595 [Nocardia terpenica]NQE89873.1 hypothetical protein [Nocardia terpenica]